MCQERERSYCSTLLCNDNSDISHCFSLGLASAVKGLYENVINIPNIQCFKMFLGNSE